MGVFGPFYPHPLQASVNHAERLRQVLLDEETRVRDSPSVSAWLVGRAGELEQVVAWTIEEWRMNRRSAGHAARSLGMYVRELHEGLASRLGVTAPACCGGPDATTETPPRPEGQQALLDSIDLLLANLESPRRDPRWR